jgi:predicted secreted hydrolase
MRERETTVTHRVIRRLARAASLLILAAAPAGAGGLQLEQVLGNAAAAGFARADQPRSFRFPDDLGPHPDFRSEWWYLTLNLTDSDGQPVGVQFTVFRQALVPPAARQADANPWRIEDAWLGHLAVTDGATGRHVAAERLARGHPALAGATARPFAVWLDGWRLAETESAGAGGAQIGTAGGRPGPATWTLRARTDRVVVALDLVALKPPVLQGEAGLSRKGPGQASYYFSVPRLAASGAVTVDGATRRVQGRGWFDREWSTSVLGLDQIGWDWFGLHLDNGEDLMAFRLRRRDGARDPHDHGTWVARDGRATPLGPKDFTLTPLAYWRDAVGVEWPVAWRLTRTRPSGVETLTIVAVQNAQRMDTLITYWEGLVRVQDADGRPVGAGYMELTGYADRPADAESGAQADAQADRQADAEVSPDPTRPTAP